MRLKAWLWLIIALMALNVMLVLFGRQWRFESIVVHHSAGSVGNYETIRAMHEKRGWTDAAYHLLLSNGSTSVPSGYLEPTTRFKTLSSCGATRNHKANLRSLHLCVVGDYETNKFPKALRPALAHALTALCKEFSIAPERIVFHRDLGNTSCPGKHLIKDDLAAWMRDLANNCSGEIKAQHCQAVATSALTFSSYPTGLLTLQACVSLIFFIIFFGLARILRHPTHHNRHNRSTQLRHRSAASASRLISRKKVRRNRHL